MICGKYVGNFWRTLRRERNPVSAGDSAMSEVEWSLGARGHDSRFQHGVHRRHSCERGVTGAAGEPERHNRGRAVGHRGLLAPARRASPCRRISRRSLRTPPGFPGWRRTFRCRLGLVRTCGQHRSTHCRARSAGTRSSPARSGQSRNHQQFVSGERTWTRHRHLVGFQCDHHSYWTSYGWLVNRTRFMARRVLH